MTVDVLVVWHTRLKIVYRPLPEHLTIMPSKIEGLGLFTLKEIENSTTLGLTHYYFPEQPNGYLRTPLGGFINHSDRPNCALYTVGPEKYLVTERDIEPGEELTVAYTMYDVQQKV
jgi:hypothetical protein